MQNNELHFELIYPRSLRIITIITNFWSTTESLKDQCGVILTLLFLIQLLLDILRLPVANLQRGLNDLQSIVRTLII